MVQAQPVGGQIDQSRKPLSPQNSLVWSIYDEIHKLAVQPVEALINLVGSKDTTHAVLTEIIQTGIREIITKTGSNVTASYAAPRTRIQSLDLPSPCPRGVKRQRSIANEVGYLKRNFFTSLAYNKPAVTIFVFDWRDWAKYVPAGETFDWKEHETLVLEQIRAHSQTWLKDLSVPTRYMIIILFPQAQPGQNISYNIDQCMTSFRRAVQLSGDENIKSSNYFLSNGFEALKTGMMKKFVKNTYELIVSYYREKKNNLKRKQKKLIGGQPQHIRYAMHGALYSLITSNDFAKSIEKLDAAYQQMKSTQIGPVSKFSDEKRDNADVCAMTILSLYLQSNQVPKFIEFYRNHFRTFQKDMASLKADLRIDEMKWRSCWFNTMGKLLERYYKSRGGIKMIQGRQWHTQESLDYFPGYYFLNCMLQLIARQQELSKLKLDCLLNGKQLYDHAVLETVVKANSSYLGKEFEVADPASSGKTVRSGAPYEQSMTQYKLYEESQVQLGIHILTAGQIAIGYYRQRGQLMQGPTGSLYMRTIHFINYHLSELLDKTGRDEEDGNIIDGVKPLNSIQEKQKHRRVIQTSLVKEKWTKQAVQLIERSKAYSANLEEYFQNEMKILLNCHNLQNHKRHQRLMELVEKVQSERIVDKEPIKLTGIVQGTSLLWARARFEHDTIQINKFNKLTVEVFSRLSMPMKISKLSIMMSQVDLSQEIDFTQDDTLTENYYVLSKTNPIKLERQFYLNREDDQIGQIMLNQILLEVAPKKAAGIIDSGEASALPQNKLYFSISPYLAPEESLLDLTPISSQTGTNSQRARQVKRLPPPIMYTIEPLPQKIKIEAIQSDAKDQALLGDPYDIKLRLAILENVKLRSLKAIFTKFSTVSTRSGVDDSDQLDGSRSRADTAEGMVDVDLSQVSIKTGQPINSDEKSQFSNLSASMFSPNMSQFYQNARGILSASTMMPISDSSRFLGADPSMGVAVLRRSLASAKRAKVADDSRQATGDLLGQVTELNDETEFAPVEMYYTKGQSQNVEDLTAIVIDTEQPDVEKVVDLLKSNGEVDELNLKMIFYQEGKLNNLTVHFTYEFTQNQGLEDEATHLKAFDYNINVRSQSPFSVEWQVKSSDCFLGSLQHFYSLHLGAQDQLRKFLALANRQSIFSQSNSLPIKEEISALNGNMVAPEEQYCWLVCKLTSQSQYKDTTIKNIRLQLNPEIAEFVEIMDSVGCNNEKDQAGDADEEGPLSIEPGETYEVLFKLKVGKVKLAKSFIEDADGFAGSSGSTTKANQDQEGSVVDQVNLLKKLYSLQQMELFSELHFEWSSFEPEDEFANMLDLKDDGNPELRKTNDAIPCCVGSPPINFVTRPLQVRIRNQRDIETVRLHEPFTVEYEISNLTTKFITAIGELQTFNDGPQKAAFMVAGEIKSRLHLMPTDEGYILRYTLFPQQLGSVILPKFTISDISMQTLYLIKDFTIKVYVTSA